MDLKLKLGVLPKVIHKTQVVTKNVRYHIYVGVCIMLPLRFNQNGNNCVIPSHNMS